MRKEWYCEIKQAHTQCRIDPWIEITYDANLWCSSCFTNISNPYWVEPSHDAALMREAPFNAVFCFNQFSDWWLSGAPSPSINVGGWNECWISSVTNIALLIQSKDVDERTNIDRYLSPPRSLKRCWKESSLLLVDIIRIDCCRGWSGLGYFNSVVIRPTDRALFAWRCHGKSLLVGFSTLLSRVDEPNKLRWSYLTKENSTEAFRHVRFWLSYAARP